MSVNKLQQDLEEIYGLDAFPAIERFLVSTEEIKEILPKLKENESLHPQVLFQQEGEEVFLAVHFGDETLERIQKQGLKKSTLSDFCSVAEEVSHFLYLSWRAKNQRPVSLLDVELQGEIDKFLLACKYFESEEDLYTRMFEDIQFHHELPPKSKDRYREANRLGSKFVKTFGMEFQDGELQTETRAELRNFYRLASQTRLCKVSKL